MAMYKTRYTETGNRMRGTRGMFTRIPGNRLEDSGKVIILTFRGMFQRIRGMLEKIQGNVRRDCGKCS